MMRALSRSLLVAGLSTLLLTGCPGDGGKGGEAGKAGERSIVDLEKRAREFWAARVARDVLAAFEYEDAKPLGTLSLQQYASSRSNLVYKRAEVKGAECTSGAEDCVVRVAVDYIVPGLSTKPISQDIEDSWHLVQGRWYHHFKTGLQKPGAGKAKEAAGDPQKQP